MPYFAYGQVEIVYLSKRCKKMGELIERLGPLERSINPDIFESLVSSIISQQISVKGAATVYGRLQEKVGDMTPDRVAALPLEEVQTCGTSTRKAMYIKGIADAVLDGRLNVEELRDLPNDEVIRRLSALKGVGVWTAEMLMIFSLERQDVLSYLDLGIRKGLMLLYGKKNLTPGQFEVYRKRFSPCGSVASLYLWALAGQQPSG